MEHGLSSSIFVSILSGGVGILFLKTLLVLCCFPLSPRGELFHPGRRLRVGGNRSRVINQFPPGPTEPPEIINLFFSPLLSHAETKSVGRPLKRPQQSNEWRLGGIKRRRRGWPAGVNCPRPAGRRIDADIESINRLREAASLTLQPPSISLPSPQNEWCFVFTFFCFQCTCSTERVLTVRCSNRSRASGFNETTPGRTD